MTEVLETVQAQVERLQPRLWQQLQQAVQQEHLAHAFLFTGPAGRGQVPLAHWLAMVLMRPDATNWDLDETSSLNRRILNGEHPDVVEVFPEGKSLKVDQIRTLQTEFTKTAVEGQRKVLIIHAADTMTDSAANSLLKFIEEPLGDQTVLLLAENRARILPTIVSRTQVIDFLPLPPAQQSQAFVAAGVPEALLTLTMRLTDSPAEAAALLEEDWLTHVIAAVDQLVQGMLKQDPTSFTLVQTTIQPLIKEREGMTVMLDALGQAWRDLLLARYATVDFTTSYPQQLPTWQQLGAGLSDDQLSQLLDHLVQAKQRLQVNIGTQTVLETLVLESLFTIVG